MSGGGWSLTDANARGSDFVGANDLELLNPRIVGQGPRMIPSASGTGSAGADIGILDSAGRDSRGGSIGADSTSLGRVATGVISACAGVSANGVGTCASVGNGLGRSAANGSTIFGRAGCAATTVGAGR